MTAVGGKCFADGSHGVVMFKLKFGLSRVPKVMHLAHHEGTAKFEQ